MSPSSLTPHLQPQTVTVQFEPPRGQDHAYRMFTVHCFVYIAPRGFVYIPTCLCNVTADGVHDGGIFWSFRQGIETSSITIVTAQHQRSYLATDGPR